LPVKFGHRDVTFRLYTDGRVILMDGAGHSHTLRVEPWPVIEGAGSRPEDEPVPDPKVHYPFNRS
jgi:hypothetical protein